MSDGLGNALKFAIIGTGVGSATAVVTDAIYQNVIQTLAPTGSSIPGGNMGRAAFTFVSATALAATMIYAGDKVADSFGAANDDPLFRLFYYQTAFHAMRTSSLGPTALRAVINSFGGSSRHVYSPPQPKSAPPPSGKSKSGCMGKASCGNLRGM